MLVSNPSNPTAQKIAYVLLTSALYHAAHNREAGPVLMSARSAVAAEMTWETLCESSVLIEMLVYPRH